MQLSRLHSCDSRDLALGQIGLPGGVVAIYQEGNHDDEVRELKTTWLDIRLFYRPVLATAIEIA